MRFKLTLKHPINIKADGSGQTQSAVWLDEASKCKEVSRWWHYAHWLCYYVRFLFFLRWCSLKVFPLLSSGSWREACVRQSGLNRDGGSSRVLLNPPPLISDAPLLISPPQLRKKTLLVMLRSNDSKLRQPEKGEEGKKKKRNGSGSEKVDWRWMSSSREGWWVLQQFTYRNSEEILTQGRLNEQLKAVLSFWLVKSGTSLPQDIHFSEAYIFFSFWGQV